MQEKKKKKKDIDGCFLKIKIKIVVMKSGERHRVIYSQEIKKKPACYNSSFIVQKKSLFQQADRRTFYCRSASTVKETSVRHTLLDVCTIGRWLEYVHEMCTRVLTTINTR